MKWAAASANGKKLKAVVPGGSSCSVLTAEEVEVATMDFDSFAQAREYAGLRRRHHHRRTTCMVKAALRIMRFYAHESCGWCIPCREGTDLAEEALRASMTAADAQDIDNLISDLAKNMLGRTFCPLGDAAAMPTISIVDKFRTNLKCIWKGVLARLIRRQRSPNCRWWGHTKMSAQPNPATAVVIDKQFLLTLLQETREVFLNGFPSITEEQSRLKPAPDCWSVLRFD